jgi:hypothetical protein
VSTRLGAAVTFAFALALLEGQAWAEAPHVHVRGTARIDAHAARASGKLVLSGTVVDDAARPISGARVGVTVSRGSDPANTLPLASLSPSSCDERLPGPMIEKSDTMVLPTGDDARFCVRLSLGHTDKYVAHLDSRAAPLVDAAHVDVPVDLAVAPVTLRFDPERTSLSLDSETTPLDVVASTDDEGVTTPAAALPLTLSNEAGAALGSATTDRSGRAHVVVSSVKLGPAGRGEIRVAFAGNAEAGASRHAMQVERRTHVELSAPDATEGRLPTGAPEDGITVRVVATARCAHSGCAGGPTGSVEARVGEAIVGAAPLDGSEAHVVVTFALPSSADVPIELRYVPDAPWFERGAALELVQPVHAPSPMRKAPLVLASLAVVALLILVRLPQRAKKTTRTGKTGAAARPEAHVELVRAAPASHGWTGRVVDAHEGTPVAAALVTIERRGFERMEIVVRAQADASGGFALAPATTVTGDELVASGRLHTRVRKPVPPSGELSIALVARKRAVLERLVEWARRRGAPYDAAPDATPGHVRRAASSEFAVARWADAVERAAYGGQPVDERVEEDVDRLGPEADAAAGVPGAPPRNDDLGAGPRDDKPGDKTLKMPDAPAVPPRDRESR